ncbi:MAG: GMP/IMP nucleotidase [bacterium]|nr:GMP/IMP nucleotidase [bacterium]MDT8396875.1 GMP/IMP nucleotidase [bacterium]
MTETVIFPPDWNQIDTVLLDMDGTLLDKSFDDHFWEEYVPSRYAEQFGVSEKEARDKLLSLYRSQEETLNWTSLDYWTEQLGLDILDLKRQVDHLITVHPFVVGFLDRVREAGKKVYLVTNAHGKTLDLKMGKTALAGKFDGITTAHDIGMPKEEPGFWRELRRKVPFDPERTLLGEDTEAVLISARRFGIRFLVFVSNSSSAKPPRGSDSFFSIERFVEIMPE